MPGALIGQRRCLKHERPPGCWNVLRRPQRAQTITAGDWGASAEEQTTHPVTTQKQRTRCVPSCPLATSASRTGCARIRECYYLPVSAGQRPPLPAVVFRRWQCYAVRMTLTAPRRRPASTAQLGLCKLAVEHCAHTEGAKPRTYRRHHEVGRNPERAPAVDAVGRGEWRLYRQHSTESCGGRGKGKDGAWAGAQGIFGLCIELAFGDRDRPVSLICPAITPCLPQSQLFGPWTRSAQSPLESRFPARDEGGNPLPPLPSSKHAGTSSSAAVHPGPPP
ncbi:hypothetical protein C8Q77DRAFT_764933 [Trametes polyzona]|nr:hypothetical protein C8Q77DRAFT_764933 [Trametes polyzona]